MAYWSNQSTPASTSAAIFDCPLFSAAYASAAHVLEFCAIPACNKLMVKVKIDEIS